ncbi:hypothetical protein M501DRAFT_928032 [Patellaria atrata CBS 101060]|uniref:Zf-UBP-domain-containing protein n=1 Tax=Patellaria atrata CBS 101060 TaxID=1346257 RepID=A0A9P4VS97_9PEZI|nr:hypothetical protein M501DRAFT_928032 [Patellaria atrata CBS 101060]
MPSYFYHLAFELYPSPPSIYTQLPDFDPHNLYLPPPGTDIFRTSLPAHSISSWDSRNVSRGKHRRSKTTHSVDLSRTNPTDARPTLRQRGLSYISSTSPSELRNSPVPIRSGTISSAPTEVPAPRDWRFGSVSIQSIDLEMVPPAQNGIRPVGKLSNNNTHVGASQGGLATKGKYIPSNPKNTEVGWGVVHLYRDPKETPRLDDETASSAGSENGDAEDFDEDKCTTLCILAVPSYMTPSDLLGYVGEQTREDVSHFRLIRTGRTNKYMVLMKFREAKKAKAWREQWDGKLFNSMEPENCHVVFVKSIEFQTSLANRDPSSFPEMTNDPFTPAARPAPTAPLPINPSSPIESSSMVSSLSTKPLAPPTPALIELPTCPVCLERMDETTGLLTILCQHVFHCACLEKWRGSGCPVCRYTQNDSMLSRAHNLDGDGPENECSVCGSTTNLWICLICGNTGCGRYDEAHAFAHYEATSHSYAMDIETQHVWDYAGDGYVHRLIQNKADNKLIDLPTAYSNAYGRNGGGNNTMTGFGEDTVPREKLDNMGMEYAYLLTSQLDSQRTYFEEQVERAVDKASKASSAAEKAAATAADLATKVEALQSSYTEATRNISDLEKDAERNRRKAERAEMLARTLTKSVQEEKSLNGALSEKIKFLESKIGEVEGKCQGLEQEKRELEEQNRDLSFFISGQEKLREMEETEGLGEEVQGGRIEVPVQPEASGGRKRRGKGRK